MALPMSKIVMNLKTESSHYEKKNVFNYHRVLPFSIWAIKLIFIKIFIK